MSDLEQKWGRTAFILDKRPKTNDPDLREHYYTLSDGLIGLGRNIATNSATRTDRDLAAALTEVRLAFDKFGHLLNQYRWD